MQHMCFKVKAHQNISTVLMAVILWLSIFHTHTHIHHGLNP